MLRYALLSVVRPRSALLLALVCLVPLASCRPGGNKPENLSVPRLMLESRGVDYGAMRADTLTLPVSGTSVSVARQPLINEFQITNAELVKVDMGLALLLQTTELGARALYRGTVTNMSGRIVLTVNDNPIGARRIDGPIQDGNFYTFVEMDDEALEQLVLDLKESIVYLQKNK